MEMTIASEHDLPAIEHLYASVADAMRGTLYDCAWRMGVHPTRDGLRDAVRAGDLFVARSVSTDRSVSDPSHSDPSHGEASSMLGAFVLNDVPGPGYADAPWKVADPGEAAVLHLLATSPFARGRSVGRALVEAAAHAAVVRGRISLRLDVFVNNTPAVTLYRRCGFDTIGTYELGFDGGIMARTHLMELDLRPLRTPGA